jgi:hypothetical protein
MLTQVNNGRAAWQIPARIQISDQTLTSAWVAVIMAAGAMDTAGCSLVAQEHFFCNRFLIGMKIGRTLL